MTPEASDPEPRLLSYRVGEVEKAVTKVDVRLERIEGQLAGLTVLAQMEKRLDARIDGVTQSTTENFAMIRSDVAKNWAAFVALLVLLLGAIITVLTRLGGVFG